MTTLTAARRPRLWSVFVLAQTLAVCAVVVVVAVVWVHTIKTLTHPVAVPPPVGSPQSLVWSNRVFSSRASLEAWLKARGLSYVVWARKHGAAAAVVEHRPAVVAPHTAAPAVKKKAHTQTVAAQHQQPKRKAETAATKRSAAPPPSSSSGSSSVSYSLAGWLLALLMGAIALVPTRVLARVGGLRVGPSLRTYLAAASATIIVAMFLAAISS